MTQHNTTRFRTGAKRERVCWQCGRSMFTDADVCPHDGARLVDAVASHREDPLIGNILDDRFVMTDRIGEGGMGMIYQAHDLQGLGDVALKVLKADFLRDEDIRRRFLHEARIIANLQHPNAVRVYDLGQMPDGGVYMVMELLRGESLAERLAYTFMTYEEVFEIVPPICEVLDEAHAQGIVHRDLKPENIFLAEDAEGQMVPKLLDFGVAKQLQATTMTRTGTLWGTPAYMSPEQARGDTIGAHADIYAIGIILYELICGNLPFHATTHMGYAMRHMHEAPRSLHTVPGLRSVPEALDALILQALAKQPQERPASAGAIARALREIKARHFASPHLLTSTPAEEVDPLALKIWMQDAPDLSSSSKELLIGAVIGHQDGFIAPLAMAPTMPHTPPGLRRETPEELPSVTSTLEFDAFEDSDLELNEAASMELPPFAEPLVPDTPPRLRRSAASLLGEPVAEAQPRRPIQPTAAPQLAPLSPQHAPTDDAQPSSEADLTPHISSPNTLETRAAAEAPAERSLWRPITALAIIATVIASITSAQQMNTWSAPQPHVKRAPTPETAALVPPYTPPLAPPLARYTAPSILADPGPTSFQAIGDDAALPDDHMHQSGPPVDTNTITSAASSAVEVVLRARSVTTVIDLHTQAALPQTSPTPAIAPSRRRPTRRRRTSTTPKPRVHPTTDTHEHPPTPTTTPKNVEKALKDTL